MQESTAPCRLGGTCSARTDTRTDTASCQRIGWSRHCMCHWSELVVPLHGKSCPLLISAMHPPRVALAPLHANRDAARNTSSVSGQ